MCGICLILSNCKANTLDKEKDFGIDELLTARGPDLINSNFINFPVDNKIIGYFKGCVLWLQGLTPQLQPISDLDRNTLLWNGDNLSLKRDRKVSDSEEIFAAISNKSEIEIVSLISSIEGPWSFIYYDSSSQKIFFGRDILGRRSLLWSSPQNQSDAFILTSAANRLSSLEEVPALGIFVLDLKYYDTKKKSLSLYLYRNIELEKSELYSTLNMVNVIENPCLHFNLLALNKQIPSADIIDILKSFPTSFSIDNLAFLLNYFINDISLFSDILKNSLKKRILASPSMCKNCTKSLTPCSHSKFAVMFSGGLDSAIIAYYLHCNLAEFENIDLLNVSFEILPKTQLFGKNRNSKSVTSQIVCKSNFASPDRESGINCWNQLCKLFPQRTWNFIEINITAEELQKERLNIISDLIAPQASVLDDSIGCALYFCGRGEGFLNKKPYRSSARILFSGLGADEQLAGYSRHRGKFETAGWEGLLEEIDLEMKRIPYRNLGRDDRVLSHHGRSVRFPYLDEEMVSYLNSLPIWKKANLYLPRGIGEKLLLRVLAESVGLSSASSLPKRAIQFGSRIAKLENRKEKGGDACQRLGSLCIHE